MTKKINVIGCIRQVLFLIFAAFFAGALFTLLFVMPFLIMIASINATVTIEEGLNMFIQATIVTVFFIGCMGIENGAFEYSYLMELEDDWQKTKSKAISKICKWTRHRKLKRIK